ncbi:type I restriction enzyme, S subunit [Ruminococcus sp. YRD2003]|uniref:restriction endonuclease subunit S n=1 Tax=Ruminococcus sp. YRD2003 TaxID=1452313 RepID=UPI0008AE8E97|nr:type I restriction enzyme, S subunit [Ruminococcus flavefaciens]
MRVYESYQASNIDWLPSIPETWSAKRIKGLFSLHDERNNKPLNEVNLISLYTHLGVRQHSDLEHTTGNKARNADGYKIVNIDDIIVNIMLCWMGAIGRSAYNGVTSPAYDVYTPHDGVNSSYYHYLFRTPLFSQQCFKNGHGIMMMRWRTYSPEFTSIVVPVPPREEQDQIVRFLDWKVSEINRLISLQKAIIQNLSQTKRKIINSRITSISERIRLKYIAKCNCYSLSESTDPEYSFRYIDIGSVNYTEGITQYEMVTFKSAPSRARRIVKKHDIIISTVRTYLKAITTIIDDEDVIVSTGFAVVQPDSALVDSRFLEYCCKSDWFCDEVIRHSNGVAYPAITSDALMNLLIPFCDYEDQKSIVSYLDTECSKIDHIIDIKEKIIDELKEFRKRLISDVVTGKIDVRGIEIPEYEYTDEEADSDSKVDDEYLDEGADDE